MAVKEILKVPKDADFISRQSVAVDEKSINTPQFQTLIDDLLATAQVALTPEGWRSAGLAAVQIGELVTVFVARKSTEDAFTVFVNPTIELLGTSTDTRPESCLSIPWVVGEVQRHKRIRVKFLDRFGNVQQCQYDGFLARVIQHEYDHFLGILFTAKVV